MTRTICYLDCGSGISGDMFLGALIDAGVPLAALQEKVDSLGLPSCRLVVQEVKKKGFRATQLTVEHEPEHKHRHLHHIAEMIEGSTLTAAERSLATRIFTRIAEAEAKVHGSTLEKVHFHEVGAVDSIADVVGAAVGWQLLGASVAVASPVPTGTGKIKIAHGLCSIPAPATGELLRGVPLAESQVPFELTTPTGAAILQTIVERFGPLPSMAIDRIGYGAGQRDLEGQPNLLRILIGTAADYAPQETVWVLETNLDDETGEQIGFTTAKLLEAGALDVYTTSIQMKKNRPGVVLTVLCEEPQAGAMEQILFRETTTLGVRRWPVTRRVLPRSPHQVNSPWGPIEGKRIELTGSPVRFSPEYESCARIAREQNLPLRDVYEAARKAWSEE